MLALKIAALAVLGLWVALAAVTREWRVLLLPFLWAVNYSRPRTRRRMKEMRAAEKNKANEHGRRLADHYAKLSERYAKYAKYKRMR